MLSVVFIVALSALISSNIVNIMASLSEIEAKYSIAHTVEPVLGDHPFCPAKAVSQDRWSLIAGRTKIMFYCCVAYIFTDSQAYVKRARH